MNRGRGDPRGDGEAPAHGRARLDADLTFTGILAALDGGEFKPT